MTYTFRDFGENTQPRTISEDKLTELLANTIPSSKDITKDPKLDILVALFLYPNSTYDGLIDFGFDRFKQIWDKNTPGLVNQGLIQETPNGLYSLTAAGTDYMYSELRKG